VPEPENVNPIPAHTARSGLQFWGNIVSVRYTVYSLHKHCYVTHSSHLYCITNFYLMNESNFIVFNIISIKNYFEKITKRFRRICGAYTVYYAENVV